MTLTCVIVILLTSLLALPMSYLLNIVAQGKDQTKISITGAIVLLIVALLPQYIIRIRSKPAKIHSFIHVLSLLTFNSVMSLIISLENDGLIAEFLGSFLREGEPYLKSAHGTMVCYWDGIGHNAMYLTMMAAISWNQSFYDIGLYWSGSFIHRLVVLFLAVMTGREPVKLAFLLYCPFVVIGIWAAKKFLDEKSEETRTLQNENLKDSENRSKHVVSIWKRPVHLIFMTFYLLAAAITVFRFTVSMGSNKGIAKTYIEKVEPYLGDTLTFSRAEVMVQLFYFVPYYAMNIYALLNPGQSWVPRWSIIFAGSVGQGQYSYMGSSFHYRTPYIYRVPQTLFARSLFWSINGMLFLLPQIMSYKYNSNPEFFLSGPKITNKLENGTIVINGKDASVKKKE